MIPWLQEPRPAALPVALYAFSGSVVKRNLLIASIVGCILSLANQYDAFARHEFTSRLAAKVLLNFIIPFTVSTVSALVNYRPQQR